MLPKFFFHKKTSHKGKLVLGERGFAKGKRQEKGRGKQVK